MLRRIVTSRLRNPVFRDTGSRKVLEMNSKNVIDDREIRYVDIWKMAVEVIRNSTRLIPDCFIHVDQHRGPLLFHETITTRRSSSRVKAAC